MDKLLLILLLIAFINPLKSQPNNFDKNKLLQIKNYRSMQLDNGLTVICLTTHDKDNFFIRSYTDLPGYVAKQYQTLLLVDAEMRKFTDFKLPAGWNNADLQSENIKLSKDAQGYYASCKANSLNKTLKLFANIFQNPFIEPSKIQKAKQNILSNADSLAKLPTDRIDKITKSIIYGKQHPLLNELDKNSLKSINSAEYKDFYERFYKPNNSYLLVIGNISLDSVKMLSNNVLSAWKSKDIPKSDYKLIPIKEPKIVFFDTIPTGATNIKILFPFALYPFTFNSEKAELLSILFQDLLSNKLVNQLQLANRIEAKFESDKITGNYQLNVHLNSDSINAVIQAIISTISQLNKADYPEEKLSVAKQKIISEFTKQNTDDKFISKLIINGEINNLPKEYYANFIDDINGVDKTNMRTFAAKYLNYNTSLFQIPGNWYKSLNDFIELSKNFRIELYELNGKIKKVIPKGFNGFSVVDNYVDAIGGTENIKKLKNVSIKFVEVYYLPNENEKLIQGEFLHKDGNRYFSNLNLIRQKQQDTIFLHQQIYDGTVGRDSTMSGTKMLSGSNLRLLKYKSTFVPEMHYKEWNYKAGLIRADTLNGAYVWVVEMSNLANQNITDFYDVDKGLRYKRIIKDNAFFKQRTITYGKYTLNDKKGIIYPYYKKIVGGNTIVKMLIGDIDFKTKIDKRKFER